VNLDEFGHFFLLPEPLFIQRQRAVDQMAPPAPTP